MNKYIAFLFCILFVMYLFVRERRLHPITSRALWLVLIWVTIVGSRPVSFWFSTNENINIAQYNYIDGSPLDRSIFSILIFLGIYILWKRRVSWVKFYLSNRCLFGFFFYCGMSIIWSDDPFVSFKRWIKDFGNLVMIFIILSDKDPVQATRFVFSRFSYIAIPFSVLFRKSVV